MSTFAHRYKHQGVNVRYAGLCQDGSEILSSFLTISPPQLGRASCVRLPAVICSDGGVAQGCAGETLLRKLMAFNEKRERIFSRKIVFLGSLTCETIRGTRWNLRANFEYVASSKRTDCRWVCNFCAKTIIISFFMKEYVTGILQCWYEYYFHRSIVTEIPL